MPITSFSSEQKRQQQQQQNERQQQQQQPTVHRQAPKIYEAWYEHEYTFFILHGRGDSSDHFAPALLLASTTGRGSFQNILRNVKLVFVSAGLPSKWRPDAGEWFRMSCLRDTNKNSHEQIEGLSEHASIIQAMIEAEVQSGIPHEHIVLIGLSQGCAQSLFSLLTIAYNGTQRLGAVVGMSGWLPFSDIIDNALEEVAPATSAGQPASNRQALQVTQRLCEMAGRCVLPDSTAIFDTPVFLGHGALNQRVHPNLGKTARDLLQRLGFEVAWFSYNDLGHWWKAPEEIDDILAFLGPKISLEFSKDGPPASYWQTRM